MVSLTVNDNRETAPAASQRVVMTSLVINALALPVWFILALAGCITGIFLFLPWSSMAGQIVFIVISVLIGLLFAGLHWGLSRRRMMPSLHVRDLTDPCADSNMTCHHVHNNNHNHNQQQQQNKNKNQYQYQQQQQLDHRFVSNGSGRCCSCASFWYTHFRDALPALELLILGILVLISPHVMVDSANGNDIIASPDKDNQNGILYPVEIVWKVCSLHFLFLFSTCISIAVDLFIGIVHFGVLMANYKKLGSGTILVSIVWLVVPIFCILVAVIQYRRRLRWQKQRQQQWSGAEDLYVVNDDIPIARINSHMFQYVLDTVGNDIMHPSILGRSGHLETRGILSPTALRFRRRSSGNDTQNTEPLISEVQQYEKKTDSLFAELHCPYLVLSLEDNIIRSASMSFAAHVGMTVGSLVGRKLTVILKELEVENMGEIMSVIHTVAHPGTGDSPSLSTSTSRLMNWNREKVDGQLLRNRNSTNNRGGNMIISKESHSELGAGVDVDNGEYSTIQGTVTPARMGDSDVQRILLRGRRPHQTSIINSDMAITTALSHSRTGSTSANGGGVNTNGNHSRSPTLSQCREPSALYFCLLLDVCMEQRNGTGNSNNNNNSNSSSAAVIVLRQPRLHWSLDWIPLPCFLVHPTTGRVLYWSRTAEQQTGQLAYKMVGWPVQVSPLQESSSLEMQNHNHYDKHKSDEERIQQQEQEEKENNNKHEQHPTIERWTRLESPLQAILHLPFSGAGSLMVSLQPISGESVGDEAAALEDGVTGLIWPPRYHMNTETVVSETRRASSYPRGLSDFPHVKDTIKSTQRKQSNISLQQGQIDNGLGSIGGGFVFEPKSIPAESWYFSALTGKRDDVMRWASLGVPLLFVIQDEMPLSSSSSSTSPPNDIHTTKQEQHSFKHSLAEGMKEGHTTLSEEASGNVKPNISTMRVNDGTISPNGMKKSKHLKENEDRMSLVNTAMHSSPNNAGLIEVTSSIAGVNNTNNNITEKVKDHYDTDDGDEHASRSVFGGSNKQIAFNSAGGVVGLTPTPLSVQTSLYESKRPSPLLVNRPKEMGNEGDQHPFNNSNNSSGGFANTATTTTTTTNNNNNNNNIIIKGENGEEEKVERNYIEKSSAQVDGSVADSGLRKLSTPVGVRSPSISKNTSNPRLISPLPVERPLRKIPGDMDMNSEVVSTLKLGSGDPRKSSKQPQSHSQSHSQSHGIIVDGSGDNHYHSNHQLHHQTMITSCLATPSGAESVGGAELAASPIINSSLNLEDQPPWAMLKSSDEATIASCFIRVPPGEPFRFGRSSKCHGTTSDALVSSIHFIIVREPYQQSQYGESITNLYQNNNNNNGNNDNNKRGSCSSQRQASSLSSPRYPHLSGAWVVKLRDTSANGTYVNVKKVGKGKSCVLHDHDLVTFRLNSTRFFLGFQFLLTDERGVPLRESAAITSGPTLSRVSSLVVSRRGTPHHQQRHSSENASFIAGGSGSQTNIAGFGVNASNSGGRRAATATRSRSSRPGGGTQHRETIEWKIGEEELGSGGNAKVYLGINLTNGKLIAVKRVPLPATAPDGQNNNNNMDVLQQYRSLQEEINVLSKAVHPNIVQYYGSSQNKTHFNILLEFVPGGSLRHLLDNFGALSPGVICSYLRQMLEGLRYLHQHNIVHSDLKSANILVTDKGRVKLADFGTAKLLNRQHSQSLNRAGESEDPKSADGATFHVAGTLRWMAPELFRDSSNTGPTKASDMWSVGCVLIEMISTEAPWHEYELKAEEDIITLLKYSKEPPEIPECSEFPEMLSIAKRCLSFAPEERPTCEDLLQLVVDATEKLEERLQKLSQSRAGSPAMDPTIPVPLPTETTTILQTTTTTTNTNTGGGGGGLRVDHGPSFHASSSDTGMANHTANERTEGGGKQQQQQQQPHYGTHGDSEGMAPKDTKENS